MNAKQAPNPRSFSWAACLYILAFLTMINVMNADFPWILFCVPPLLVWPVAVSKSNWFGLRSFAWLLVFLFVGYYTILNFFIGSGHPWVIYIAFTIIWYPCSLYLSAQKNKAIAFSIFGLVWSLLFFVTVNLLTTPNEIWAIYPIFAVAWWPLSVYFFLYRSRDQ